MKRSVPLSFTVVLNKNILIHLHKLPLALSVWWKEVQTTSFSVVQECTLHCKASVAMERELQKEKARKRRREREEEEEEVVTIQDHDYPLSRTRNEFA